MSEQLTLDFKNQHTPEAVVNAEQVGAQAQVDQMEAEMNGAYSSLGNRHTYFADPEGRKQVVKRADALEKADTFIQKREQAAVQSENQSESAEDDERKAKKEALADMETDELIRAWAKAELDGDDEIAKLAQDELQDQLLKDRLAQKSEGEEPSEAEISKWENKTSEDIDKLYQAKEYIKSEIQEDLSKGPAADPEAPVNPQTARKIREDLESDEAAAAAGEASASEQDESKQKLYDYDEMVKEPVKKIKIPSTETVPVSMGEDAAEDQKITLRGRVRDRFTRIKNSVALAPAKFMNRSPEDREPMSKRKKALWGIGATAVVLGAGYGLYKFGVDSGGSDSSLTVDPADLMGGPQVDTAPDTNAIDAINNAIDSRTQEIADTEGLRPWNVAYDLYGDQATERIIEAVNDMQADGIDIQWSADPLTDNTAYLTMNGISDTEYVVDQGLAEYLARKDIENFLQATESVN